MFDKYKYGFKIVDSESAPGWANFLALLLRQHLAALNLLIAWWHVCQPQQIAPRGAQSVGQRSMVLVCT